MSTTTPDPGYSTVSTPATLAPLKILACAFEAADDIRQVNLDYFNLRWTDDLAGMNEILRKLTPWKDSLARILNWLCITNHLQDILPAHRDLSWRTREYLCLSHSSTEVDAELTRLELWP